MEKECEKVKKRNRSFMIFAKSVFNINATYIKEYDDGNLIDHQNRLSTEYFDFITAGGHTIS